MYPWMWTLENVQIYYFRITGSLLKIPRGNLFFYHCWTSISLDINDAFRTRAGVIDKWRQLEGVTVKRQEQSRQLSEMYKQLVTADVCLTRSRDSLVMKTFDDVTALETTLKSILVG